MQTEQRPGRILGSILAIALSVGTTAASAQAFPGKPIRFLVPYSPGAAPDTLARAVGQELAKAVGQPVIVENKVGADGAIAFDYVVNQAPADGHTLVIAASALATLPLTQKNLRFDALKDLPPLVGLVEGKYIFSIPASLPIKSFKELVAYAKANPGGTNFGSSNSNIQLQSEAMMHKLGIKVVHVPYKASANYLLAIATNEVQMGFTSEGSMMPLASRLRVLAVTGDKRATNFPDAPTFTELGLPEVRGVTYTVNVRAGTPKPIFDRLESLLIQVMKTPELQAQTAKMGLDPVAHSSAMTSRRLTDDNRMFTAIAKQIGLKPD